MFFSEFVGVNTGCGSPLMVYSGFDLEIRKRGRKGHNVAYADF
jgi:hypothetical protein